MNQPAQALTFENLQAIERGIFDSVTALSSALMHGLIVGFGVQTVVGDDGLRPVLTVLFHGEKDGDEPRPYHMTIPENGVNFYMLLGSAGTIASQVLNEYQQKTQKATAHFIQADEVAKVRRNGKSKLILPRGN